MVIVISFNYGDVNKVSNNFSNSKYSYAGLYSTIFLTIILI